MLPGLLETPMQERTEGRIVRFFKKHAADEPFVEQWFLVAIGDDDKAKGAVSKVAKAGEEVVEVVGRIPASNLASWGITDGEVRLVLPGEPISR
jgi:hypothetical protein